MDDNKLKLGGLAFSFPFTYAIMHMGSLRSLGFACEVVYFDFELLMLRVSLCVRYPLVVGLMMMNKAIIVLVESSEFYGNQCGLNFIISFCKFRNVRIHVFCLQLQIKWLDLSF